MSKCSSCIGAETEVVLPVLQLACHGICVFGMLIFLTYQSHIHIEWLGIFE
jgi:hypothetical protein